MKISTLIFNLMDLTEKQKRELACAGVFSGAYKSMCWSNPIRDYVDKTGFVVVSTDRNYDDIKVRYDELNSYQRNIVANF